MNNGSERGNTGKGRRSTGDRSPSLQQPASSAQPFARKSWLQRYPGRSRRAGKRKRSRRRKTCAKCTHKGRQQRERERERGKGARGKGGKERYLAREERNWIITFFEVSAQATGEDEAMVWRKNMVW